jgi:hypothetical protein
MCTSRFPLADEGLSKRDMEKGLSLAQRIHLKYRPVFDKLSEADRAAVALYFLPHGSTSISRPGNHSSFMVVPGGCRKPSVRNSCSNRSWTCAADIHFPPSPAKPT